MSFLFCVEVPVLLFGVVTKQHGCRRLGSVADEAEVALLPDRQDPCALDVQPHHAPVHPHLGAPLPHLQIDRI